MSGDDFMKLTLSELQPNEVADFWQLAFSNPNAEWTKWNGPYFHDVLPTREEFMNGPAKDKYVQNPFRQVIRVDNRMVGMVFAYYDDGDLKRWLDVGISIYDQTNWHQGLGHQALAKWIDTLWQMVDLPHIGLTTWSGNVRMIGVAEHLHLKREAMVRQVRYWQGQYWDSVKYGVLRDEWQSPKD